jgi:hypothetical protein
MQPDIGVTHIETPAEVVLRLLVVRHFYAWSYAETSSQVADSLVLRWFPRACTLRVC